MRRFAAILVALWYLALGSGTLEYLHEQQHAYEDAQEDAAHRAHHLPVADHHHDDSNCDLHAQLHQALILLTGWVPLVLFLGLLVAILSLRHVPLIPRAVPARLSCRGPPSPGRA